MKLIVALLFIFSFIYGQCFAQDDIFGNEHKVFEGGLTFGGNITKVDGDTYSGYHKVGIQAGGLVYVHFSQAFGISMELLYSQKGARGGNVKESLRWALI